MKRKISFFCLLLVAFSVFSQSVAKGYGGVELGMSLDQVKDKLKKNSEFGYNGDRDVSLLPGENRILIETDAISGFGFSFLERCWFQFYDDELYIITININKEKMDHYSIFSALCKKYGDYSMSLERPLTLKYIDKNIFNQLQQKSLVNPSGSEITREMFLEGL